MLKQRLLTSAIGLPLLLGGLIWGPKLLVCYFFLVCAAMAVFEMSSMLFPALSMHLAKAGKYPSPDGLPVKEKVDRYWIGFCVAASCVMYDVATLQLTDSKLGGIISVMILVMISGTFLARSVERSVVNITACLVSLCYGCLPWLCIWDLYLMGNHARYVLLMLAIVMLGDTGAYFAGLRFGRTKLAPLLSPKKTWEGAVGGLLASVVGALLMNLIFLQQLGPAWLMVVVAILAGIGGIMGDLVESTFKRFAGVKDSGSIFPGHGGFLDRADSILFAAPILWLVIYSYQYLTV